MNKAYERINWENYPSENTALNEANLNKMDAALNEVDNRVVAHETTKLDVATANTMVKDVAFDESTGIFTITFLNGVTKTLDTKLEKIATNFRYDYETQKLILTLVDGTTQEIDMSALITEYEFENSAYINWTVADGKVKAEIINGSITADKLQPNFLADVTLQANSAKTSEQNAKVSEENAKQSEINAKNYADSAEPVASTAQGLNPTLDNSTDALIISFKGDGATEQQTYAGKNLAKDVVYTSTTTQFSKIVVATYTLEEGEKYTVSFDTPNTGIQCYIQGDSVSGLQGQSDFILDGTRKSIVCTATTSGDYVETTFISRRGATSETATGLISNLQIEEGDTATPYEPYVGGTASPNSEYEQEIYGVGESRNLYDESTYPLTLNKFLDIATGNIETSTTGNYYATVDYIPLDYSGSIAKSEMVDICFYDENKAFLSAYSNSAKEVTAPSGTKFVRLDVHKDYKNVLQIEKGTTATPYKAYGAHSLSVKSTGACIFGGLPFAQALVDSGSTNVVLDTDAKTVTFGYNTNNHTTEKRVLFDNFKENTQYTIILKGAHDNSGGVNTGIFATNLRVVYADATGEDVRLSNTGNFEFLFTSAKDKTIDSFIYNYAEKDTTTLYYEQCGIFEGVITADEFEPYTETTADIPLSAPLYEKDYIRYNMDGTGEESHKMKAVVFDGSESGWGFAKGTDTYYAHKDLSPKAKGSCVNIYSSHFKNNGTLGTEENNIYTNTNGTLIIRTNKFTTLTEWKAWLAENKPEVVYELEEEEVTPLTAEQIAEFEKLRSFDGTTHITCEAESEIQYFCDSVSGKAVVMLNDKIESTQEEIGELSSSVASAIMVEKVSLGSKSISANTAYTYTYASSFVGYTAIGVCGFQVSNNSIAVTGAYIEDEKPTISVKNTTDTLANCTLYLYVLYQKNE